MTGARTDKIMNQISGLRLAEPYHRAADIERLFSACFYDDFRTRLAGDAVEPLYAPAAQPGDDHLVYYRQDYFASALHEIAHWCLAGAERRSQVDYGYWYHEGPRTPAQQLAFERVEARPQALEWVFSSAAGSTFHLSHDNLECAFTDPASTHRFALAVLQQVGEFCRRGLPSRARQFIEALSARYGPSAPLDFRRYQLAALI